MLTIYSNKTTDPQLHTLNPIDPGCWVNLIDPLPAEINRVGEELGIPIDYLTYPLDVDERARTEKDEGVTLIILRVPRHEGDAADIPYVTVPLGIILTERAIVTLSKVEHDLLADFSQGHVKGWSTGKRNRFVLQILLSAAQRYLFHLSAIDKGINDHSHRTAARGQHLWHERQVALSEFRVRFLGGHGIMVIVAGLVVYILWKRDWF